MRTFFSNLCLKKRIFIEAISDHIHNFFSREIEKTYFNDALMASNNFVMIHSKRFYWSTMN